MKKGYIFSLFLIMLGLLFAFINYQNSRSFLETKEKGNYVSGIVSNVEKSTKKIYNEDTGKTTVSTYYEYYVDYEYEGKEYKNVFLYKSKYSPFYSEGDLIDFLIDVNDSSVLYGPNVNISYYGVVMIMSLGFSFLVFLITLNEIVKEKMGEKKRQEIEKRNLEYKNRGYKL